MFQKTILQQMTKNNSRNQYCQIFSNLTTYDFGMGSLFMKRHISWCLPSLFLKVILLQRSIWEPEFYIVCLMFGFLKHLNKVIRPRLSYEMNSKTLLHQWGSAQQMSRESEPKDIYPPKESSLKWANDYLRRIPKGVRVCTAMPLRKVPPPIKQWMMGCVSV